MHFGIIDGCGQWVWPYTHQQVRSKQNLLSISSPLVLTQSLMSIHSSTGTWWDVCITWQSCDTYMYAKTHWVISLRRQRQELDHLIVFMFPKLTEKPLPMIACNIHVHTVQCHMYMYIVNFQIHMCTLRATVHCNYIKCLIVYAQPFNTSTYMYRNNIYIYKCNLTKNGAKSYNLHPIVYQNMLYIVYVCTCTCCS